MIKFLAIVHILLALVSIGAAGYIVDDWLSDQWCSFWFMFQFIVAPILVSVLSAIAAYFYWQQT